MCGKGASTALERLQVSLALEVDAVHEVLEELRLSLSVSRHLLLQHQHSITTFYSRTPLLMSEFAGL